jgi:hypothetical protein
LKNAQSLVLPLALTLSLCASCGETKAHTDAAIDKVAAAAKEIDLSKLTPEAMMDKVKSLSADISKKFAEIKDQASAKDVVAKLDPLVDQLKQLKNALGAKMPDMTSLKTAAQELKTKFANNQAVTDVIKPLLDKIQSMFQ